MASWDDLVKVALLGTDQQPASSLAEPSAVGQLLEKIEGSASRTREAQLLCAAGALAVHSRAGAVPATADFERPEPPTSEDDVPTCSHVAASNLRLLIDQYSENLLPLWLSKLCEAQRRIPESFAPMLLEFALKESEYRHTVAQVIGHRGRWLAAQNPDWSFATENVAYSTAELTEVFNLGTPAQRVNAIAHLRLSDPKLARELVESTWKQDSHEVRGAFLDLFVNNLSMDDEPFLEEIALPDRRKEIRALAALLLAQLPESRLHKRVLTKMLPSLKLQKVSVQESAGEKIAKMLPFLKSSTKAPTMSFSVDLPADADAEMVRDGFTKPSSKNG